MRCTSYKVPRVIFANYGSRILFLREFPIIDSAESVEQLKLRLKKEELEQYGEPFTPEYVYNATKALPRFATMRVCILTSMYCTGH
jgi:hypothetical protein